MVDPHYEFFIFATYYDAFSLSQSWDENLIFIWDLYIKTTAQTFTIKLLAAESNTYWFKILHFAARGGTNTKITKDSLIMSGTNMGVVVYLT